MIIEANEVRLGNWLIEVPDKWVQVQDLIQTEFSYLLNGLDLELFRPIPITPAFLLKAGFKKQQDCWHRGTFVIRDFLEELFFHPNGAITGQHIEQVHELQNLYYAITKEELIIEQE